MKNNKGFGVIKILIVLFIIVVIGGGIYYIKNYKSNNISLVQNNDNQNKAQYLQNKDIKVLYPLNMAKIESGSTFDVKYEVTTDKASAIIQIGTCAETIENKTKGVYTFPCNNLGQETIGPLGTQIIGIDPASGAIPGSSVKGEIQVIAPDNIKPLEIIVDDSIVVYVPVGNEPDENVAGSSIDLEIRFSDGKTRSVPFSDFSYSFDDSDLVRFYPPIKEGVESIGVGFIGNRVGKTVLHLQYQGIKKDISINSVLD